MENNPMWANMVQYGTTYCSSWAVQAPVVRERGIRFLNLTSLTKPARERPRISRF